MIYVWAGIIIIILFLLVRLVKWINAPTVEAKKTERRKAWFDFRAKRLEKWFPRRRSK